MTPPPRGEGSTPPRVTVERGRRVWVDGRAGTVESVAELRAALVRFDNDAKAAQPCDLLDNDRIQWSAPDATPTRDLLTLAPEDRRVAETRLAAIQPLLDGPATKGKVRAALEVTGMKRATLFRWLKAYRRSGGDLASLAPNNKTRGAPGRVRLDEKIEALTQRVIDDVYLKRERPSFEYLLERATLAFAENGLKRPCEKTFRRRIAARTARTVATAREGRAAGRRFDVARQSLDETARYPLHIVEIDHTPLDIHVVDPCDRAHSIGRPYLTLAIDVCTRMIFGYYLTLESPSFLSVALCLLCGVEMKDAQLRRFDLKGEWPVYGLPVSLRLDNGKEFWSKSLDDVALKYHIEVLHRRVRVPTDGPFIERVQGTFNRHLQNFAGTSKSSVAERGDYPAEERAFLTMEEVESILVRRIVEDYHQDVHETLGVSPIAAWREAIRKGDCPRALPNSAERFRIDVLPFEERTIQKDGVSLFDVRYSSATLSAVWRQEPRRGAKAPSVKYQVKYDPRDLSEVYLLTPANKVERLHTTRPAAGRFTKLMLEQSKAQARKNHRTWSDTDYLDMIRRERNAVDAAAEKTQQAKLATKRERRNAARNVAALAATTNSTSPPPSSTPSTPAPSTPPASVSGTVPKVAPGSIDDDLVVTADDAPVMWLGAR